MAGLSPERELVAFKIAFTELASAFADLAVALARFSPDDAEDQVLDLGAAMASHLRDFAAQRPPEARDDGILQAASAAIESAIELAQQKMDEAAESD